MEGFSYTDIVFGSHTITEPVIVDLLKSPPLQRLRNIDQAGYPKPFFPSLKKHTRFEHSLGVYLLLNRFGAPIEEQVAGLIHDVSHTAFSHCADYVFGDEEGGKTQLHQDNVFEEYVRRSQIPSILSSHGFHVDTVLDDRRFPLKEQPLPDLCADRIDYSLRCALAAKVKTPSEIQILLQKLTTNGKQWFFTDLTSANEFATLFSSLNTSLWCGLPSAVMFKTVGDCLRYAYQQKYLKHEDFYETDLVVLEKVQSHLGEDPQLQLLFDRMNCKIQFDLHSDESHSAVFCKSRVVDPLFLHEGELQRLSEVTPSWKEWLKKESIPKTYYIRFSKD